MDFYLYNCDEGNLLKGNPYAPAFPFRYLAAGSSGSGKTNAIINLLLGDKLVRLSQGKRGGSRYVPANDVILIGKHLEEPKWNIVRDFYKYLAEDVKDKCYEDVTFNAYSPDEIPDVCSFDSNRSTVAIFEDLVNEPVSVQKQIAPYFTSGRHSNISPIYVTQRFFAAPIIIRENLSHIALHNGGGSLDDIKRILSKYTEHSAQLAPKVDDETRKKNFILFDLTRPRSDPLSIRLNFDKLL